MSAAVTSGKVSSTHPWQTPFLKVSICDEWGGLLYTPRRIQETNNVGIECSVDWIHHSQFSQCLHHHKHHDTNDDEPNDLSEGNVSAQPVNILMHFKPECASLASGGHGVDPSTYQTRRSTGRQSATTTNKKTFARSVVYSVTDAVVTAGAAHTCSNCSANRDHLHVSSMEVPLEAIHITSNDGLISGIEL